MTAISHFLIDRANITRLIEIGNEDGTPIVDPQVVASNVPCRLDKIQSRRRDISIRTTMHEIHTNYAVIYFELGVDLKVSDLILFPAKGNEEFRIDDIDFAPGYGAQHHLEVTAWRTSGSG